MVKVLHITNDYAGSTVYMNLVRELDKLAVEQIVYTSIRGTNNIGKNAIDLASDKSEIIYSSILNWHIDRIFYPYKVFKILRDIQKKVDFSKVDFIHAHTWYSDGGVAYFLSKKYSLPFIVTVRNTDLNLFQKKLVYLRPFGRKVLERAKNIFLISASYLPRVLSQQSLQPSLGLIQDKIKILPNGVDPYWLNNAVVQKEPKQPHEAVQLIYVGRLTVGKNVPLVQQAVAWLNENTQYSAHFHIVGGDGASEVEVMELVKQYPSYFTYHGKIHNKDELACLYRAADIFVMPSSHETFGLVYVEAMLQGLPILYTANEGVDGFYSENIGEKVQTPTVQEITEKLNVMIDNLDGYSIPTKELKQNHDWAEIAKQYLSIYKEHL